MKIYFWRLGLFFLLTQCTIAQKKLDKMNPFDFEKAWTAVTDHINNGLPESALKVVGEIENRRRHRRMPASW